MKKKYTMKAWKTACLLLALQLSTGYAMAQAPANDECTGAIALTPNLECVPFNGTTVGASASADPAPDCILLADSSDVWYSFVATTDAHRVRVQNVASTNPVAVNYVYGVAIYSGSCGSLLEVACGNGQVYNGIQPAEATGTSLTVGATYYVRVWYEAATNANDDEFVSTDLNFEVCIAQPPPPPANNECTGAIAIMGTSATISGDNTSATESMPESTCGSTDVANDVWFTFTPTATGNVTINIDQANVDVVAQVFSGACGSLTDVTCTDDGYPLTVAATAGVTYYLRVYGYGEGEGAFDITFGGVALPVTGSKLSGSVTNSRAVLAWSTFSEQNNKGFTVQRSADGKTFRNAGWVASKAAKGSSTRALDYNFTDQEAITGTVYYRLQQTDIDGKTTLSNILRLSAGNDGSFAVVAAPNPVNNKLVLSTFGTQGGNAAVSVVDITGKQVKTVTVTGSETEIDMSSLSQGMYLIRYQDDNHVQTIKVSKQ